MLYYTVQRWRRFATSNIVVNNHSPKGLLQVEIAVLAFAEGRPIQHVIFRHGPLIHPFLPCRSARKSINYHITGNSKTYNKPNINVHAMTDCRSKSNAVYFGECSGQHSASPSLTSCEITSRVSTRQTQKVSASVDCRPQNSKRVLAVYMQWWNANRRVASRDPEKRWTLSNFWGAQTLLTSQIKECMLILKLGQSHLRGRSESYCLMIEGIRRKYTLQKHSQKFE